VDPYVCFRLGADATELISGLDDRMTDITKVKINKPPDDAYYRPNCVSFLG